MQIFKCRIKTKLVQKKPKTYNHVLTKIQKQKNHLRLVHVSGCFIWWAQTDLNCRPTDYESAALTN